MQRARRPSCSQAMSVVPEPENGSKTRSPRCTLARSNIQDQTPMGFGHGWPFFSAVSVITNASGREPRPAFKNGSSPYAKMAVQQPNPQTLQPVPAGTNQARIHVGFG